LLHSLNTVSPDQGVIRDPAIAPFAFPGVALYYGRARRI
jgi:hypothetical protein